MFRVCVDETFSAGHALRGYKGKCENPHGHNYKVQIALEGPELDSIGLLYDFAHLKQVIHGVIHGLDHKFLNDQAPFDAINPSAENIAKYFYDETARHMKALPAGARIARITIWETDTASATYWPWRGASTMNRSFLLIILPAIAVGLGYLLVLRWLGYELEPFRFVAVVLVGVAAVLLVQRHQRRKMSRRGR